MDTSSRGGGSGPPASPQAYRQAMEEWRQKALAERGSYESRVREQITRSFQDYTPPLYASAIGFRRDRNLLVATSRVSGFAATLGRDLEDAETKAIAEHTLDNIHTNAAFKWFTLGLAAYLTYRGRRTWQFPLWRPKPGSRFNPNEATSIFSNKKIRGPWPRFTWHTVRFTAYAAVTMLFVEPMFRAVNYIRTESTLANDPRLARFVKEADSKVKRMMTEGPPVGGPRPRQQSEPASDDYAQEYQTQDTGSTDQSQFQSQDNDFKPRPSIGGWERFKPAPSQPESSNDSWDAFDDDDDASPIATSARNQPVNTSAGGSAWDRLRQQSRTGQKSQGQSEFESRGGWSGVGRSQPQQQSESQSGWGNADSSNWGGSRESYSFNNSDAGSSSAKDQAQKEFDEMLERERSSAERGGSWRK